MILMLLCFKYIDAHPLYKLVTSFEGKSISNYWGWSQSPACRACVSTTRVYVCMYVCTCTCTWLWKRERERERESLGSLYLLYCCLLDGCLGFSSLLGTGWLLCRYLLLGGLDRLWFSSFWLGGLLGSLLLLAKLERSRSTSSLGMFDGSTLDARLECQLQMSIDWSCIISALVVGLDVLQDGLESQTFPPGRPEQQHSSDCTWGGLLASLAWQQPSSPWVQQPRERCQSFCQ